jgi:hypothetical protein
MDAHVVLVKPMDTFWRIRVLCPFCGKVHSHGGGDVTGKPTLGQRGAHCGRGEYILRVDARTEASVLFALYGSVGMEEVNGLPIEASRLVAR